MAPLICPAGNAMLTEPQHARGPKVIEERTRLKTA